MDFINVKRQIDLGGGYTLKFRVMGSHKIVADLQAEKDPTSTDSRVQHIADEYYSRDGLEQQSSRDFVRNTYKEALEWAQRVLSELKASEDLAKEFDSFIEQCKSP